MDVEVCFVCLKTFEIESVQNELSESSGIPLFTKFLKFAENYLQISPLARKTVDEEVNHVFCEKCELSVINPVCQVYLELLSAQLRLAWEMGQLEKLVLNTQRSMSPSLKVINSKSLAEKLGVESPMRLEEFRHSLAQKCQLKRTEALPVLVVSKCEGAKADLEAEFTNGNISDDDSNHFVSDTDIAPTDPLDLQGFTVHQRENESSNEMKIDIENVIKVEPIPQDPNADLIYESNDRDAVDDELNSPSNQSPKPNFTKGKRFQKKGKKGKKVKCPTYDKVLWSSFHLSRHNRYHHEPVKCNECDKILIGTKVLFSHVLIHHHKVGSYTCEVCSNVYSTREKLVVHKRKYHDMAKNKHCPFCSKSFLSKWYLEAHITAAHKPEKHPCLLCPGKVFAVKDYLRHHMRRCHGKDANAMRIEANQKKEIIQESKF
ncbi:putative zinc finger protein [Orchesella cincta]|uniref:Putative zinc finger protein n=1 Tax=Orchesella cincta TaxID=48709 RepID=A0A1D2M6K2_ORCCI|nr:putative zinc finger protein [Orchesella cincta]